jgi:hypothetical protein
MKLKFIVCKAVQKEAYWVAAHSVNMVDIVLMPQGLHNTPDKLRAEVQSELDKTCDVQGDSYDAVLLGYGLCGNGCVGLKATIKTVIPRAHDCITLLLGSRHTYQQYLDGHRGVYWYSDGWISTDTMPGKERVERLLAEYTEKYGADNAQYLLEMEQAWLKEYSWAVYVDWHLADSERQQQYTRDCATYLNWNYDYVVGSSALMQRLVDGKWDDEFLVIPPGSTIAEDLTNPGMMKAV